MYAVELLTTNVQGTRSKTSAPPFLLLIRSSVSSVPVPAREVSFTWQRFLLSCAVWRSLVISSKSKEESPHASRPSHFKANRQGPRVPVGRDRRRWRRELRALLTQRVGRVPAAVRERARRTDGRHRAAEPRQVHLACRSPRRGRRTALRLQRAGRVPAGVGSAVQRREGVNRSICEGGHGNVQHR